ncbi:hypothetical protein [Streptosporangium subroseum]|uniref:hypothetical protein n=1 Tax=Streptosporangium subroseum TaxID=106412 RepID=UPI00308D0B52|nr:hypothetical protein OHB15_08730 [Streptosporangium subroseum]
MADDHSTDGASKVFRGDVTRLRRVERAQLVGNSLVWITLSLVMGELFRLLVESSGTRRGNSTRLLIDVILVSVIVIVFILAARLRWNANPPTLTFDARGITFRDKYLGITFGDRLIEGHLDWPDIDFVVIHEHKTSESSWDAVLFGSLSPDEKPNVSVSLKEVDVTESDLADALVRFAPERLWAPADTRPTRGDGFRRGERGKS